MAGRFSVDAVFRAVDRFTRPIALMGTAVDRFTGKMHSSLGRANDAASRFSGHLSTIAGAVARVGTLAGVAGGAAALAIGKTGADFEEAITAVGAVSLMTRDQIADLEKKALELGASTKFTATEAANAMELMGRAGFTNAEILQGIDGILAAAAAEGADMAETAGHVSNVLKGMGLATTEASRVADVLTLASARTNSSISSLGGSMANVASTARQLGVPLEDTVAAVALLQDMGLDASTAGTSVARMLTTLAKPTDEIKWKMQQFGISFKDAQGNMLPFADVLANISKAADKSGGNLDKVAFLSELAGIYGQKAASNLADLFKTGQVSTLTKELEGAVGKAKEMADLRMQNLKGDLEQLSSAAEGLMVELYLTESGPLRGVVRGIQHWIDANKQLIVSGFTDFMAKVRRNLPEIVTWLKRAAIGVGVFLSLMVAVKAFQVVLAVAQIALYAFDAAFWVVKVGAGAAMLAIRGTGLAIRFLTSSSVLGRVATYALAASRWALTVALNVGRIATTRFTLATLAATAKTWLSTAAIWARNAAQWALNAVLGVGATVVNAFRLATLKATVQSVVATVRLWAMTVAHWAHVGATAAGTAAVYLFNVATGRLPANAIGAAAALGTATAATDAAAGSAVAARGAFASLGLTLGALAAAIGAVWLAWDQMSKLLDEAGGLKGLWEGVKGFATGEGFFTGVDKELDRQAKAEAEARGRKPGGEAEAPATEEGYDDKAAMEDAQRQARRAQEELEQLVPPGERISRSVTEIMSTEKQDLEITIKDDSGKAAVTKAPKGKNVRVRVGASGEF